MGQADAAADRQTLLGSINSYQQTVKHIWTQLAAVFSGAFIHSGQLPDKVTPLVRSLMNSIKREQHSVLQTMYVKCCWVCCLVVWLFGS